MELNQPHSAFRSLQSSGSTWDTVTFNSVATYNLTAPEPWIAFLIGSICSGVAFALWIRRLMTIRKELGIPLRGTVLVNSMLSATLDSDDAPYVIVSTSAVSFLFLGGLQLDFRLAFSIMMGIFGLLSCGDSLRVYLAFKKYNCLSEVVTASHMMEASLRTVTTELKPSNVYEDLGRGSIIVFMVFATQAILISFVVVVIYDSELYTCLDGTAGCPAVGTFGSWGLYVLGVFMVCVFLLGPNSNFGQSEQNPSYWLQLLLAAKSNGAKASWYDPVSNKIKSRSLRTNDCRLWLRFFMSFLINGVGFHILIHSLPLQIATQSSLLGVVFRAVGMMYLVDMDDTPGYPLTIVSEKDEIEGKDDVEKKQSTGGIATLPVNTYNQSDSSTSNLMGLDQDELPVEVKRILQEAQIKLRAWATNTQESQTLPFSNMGLMAGTLMVPDNAYASGNEQGGGNDVEAGPSR